ncbi:D-tagatose-bisphosphate aldolase, class II, non-catalytic subunit [Endozoicomonas lisbonensis]|uniref:D-tagatose-1,6-bisphosphate aldolase subunit GatZ/KbaZ n=1 Tax=Endozoicomonas lisbonensis TaxID=3120522 RepID=A0ABV2SCE2_9GAMM
MTLQDIIAAHRQGQQKGIYSVCSSHPLVIEAAILQAQNDNAPVLIESTSNQVNQYGGYTGMQPADFRDYVYGIGEKLGFPREQIWLGGDHLGPNCWQNEPAEQAMSKSKVLIEAYVAAGFRKIHLDASMSCAGDPVPLSDETVARRAAELCRVAEQTALKCFGASEVTYVIGTEVPVPGGESDTIEALQVTSPEAARYTLECHKTLFQQAGLSDAWERVIGLVVQPGVEFDHTTVVNYKPDSAQALSQFIETVPNIVYEAHSTDYQTPLAYKALVRDHFAILKVGPQLTFAMREALFGLAAIEEHCVSETKRSNIRQVVDSLMLANPDHWQKYYTGDAQQQAFSRRFSYSDRIRYYWNQSEAVEAIDHLLLNLEETGIPQPLLSQYLPGQYQAIRDGRLNPDVRTLVHWHIQQVLGDYGEACHGQ